MSRKYYEEALTLDGSEVEKRRVESMTVGLHTGRPRGDHDEHDEACARGYRHASVFSGTSVTSRWSWDLYEVGTCSKLCTPTLALAVDLNRRHYICAGSMIAEGSSSAV